MKRPIFKDNSREVRSSDLFKYLLAKEKDTAIKVAQREYQEAKFDGFRWMDTNKDLEWSICTNNEVEIAKMQRLLNKKTPAPFWPTLL